MEEMRRRLNTEELEEAPADENSQSDSQTSSVEGVYGAISGRTSHPFKVVDHDAVSLQSGVSIGGRLGRLPGASSSTYPAAPPNNTAPTGSTQTSQDSSHNTPPAAGSTTSLSSSKSQQSAPLLLAQDKCSGVIIVTEAVPSSTSLTVSESDSSNNTCSVRHSGSFVPPEPDVVISCKDKSGSLEDNHLMKAPVAPPRRKRKGLGLASSGSKLEELTSTDDDTRSKENTPEPSGHLSRHSSFRAREEGGAGAAVGVTFSPQTPPSPTVSIRSMCREMDKQLDSPNQKIWIVKAQDEEKTRAKSSGPKVLRRTESLPKDVIAAFDPSGSGSGGQRDSASRSNSNSSTLNNSTTGLNVTENNNQSNPPVPSPAGTVTVCNTVSNIVLVSNSNSNSAGKAPGNQQLSSLISAMAALEETSEAESQLNMNLRTRTDSGKLLSDLEILEQVEVIFKIKSSLNKILTREKC